MLTICTNRPQRSTCERMWACETLGGAWDSSVKQNWNLQKVPKAAPARTSFFLNALSAALRFNAKKQDSSWWGCDRTDGLLTDRGATDVGGRIQNLQTELERQKAKGGYFSRMTEAVDELFRLLPPLTCHLFALVWYLFCPRKSTANLAQVAKRSWTHIFSHLFCLLSCISVWLNLALVFSSLLLCSASFSVHYLTSLKVFSSSHKGQAC